VLIEHTEEAIVSGRFPVVIPFLGVTSYLISVVKLESEERIDNLERRSGLGVSEKCDVLIDKEYVGRRFRWAL
jgi:hypothetical protein